ncbi:hypothetical protein PVK06_024004 [Gossypium arboreum]|uniref:Reverse transcriptase Ty1/copia-type domain-containing protein n=1 Tax=Gossypium arboreum TaxID=29729 RepID=A0ABR0PCR9_GOSAR|nr:hypothetical protein PVK06_024004 [Gossypium arboreum]
MSSQSTNSTSVVPQDRVVPSQALIDSRSLTTSTGDPSSSTPTVAIPLCPESFLPTINAHPVVTRSKAGIFKPKFMTVEAIESSTIEEVFSTFKWRAVAQAKYDAFIRNSTWELVQLPPNRKVVGCKWLFKVKKNPDDTIARRKARLVAKGCSQVSGFDFQDTFSPVVKPAIINHFIYCCISRLVSLSG